MSKEENKDYHKKHKRNALAEMAEFDSTRLVSDLIHTSEFGNKKHDFGDEENLLDMLPTQLTITKNSLTELLQNMYSNYNYFYKVIGPLHL